MKSYGRAPSFLAMTGFEQVRSVVAALDGDLEAAARVELVLPETGVCNGAGAFDDPDAVAPAADAAALRPRPSRSWSPSAAPASDGGVSETDGVMSHDGTLSQATTQPGALDGAGLRHVVAVLSTVQIVSWGVLYYAFAALQSSITADTGWSSVAVTGAFSLAQFVSGGVGIWVGRHIDDFGPRKVMTAASLVAIPGVATVALAPNLAVFYLGWVLAGVAMAGTLYPPAFAALTHWGGDRRVRALTTLTLVAGLASTVFAPLASGLDDWLGWRRPTWCSWPDWRSSPSRCTGGA